MKTCNKCKISKEHSQFHKDKSKDDGLRIICKQCCKEYHSSPEVLARKRERWQEKYSDPEARKERSRKTQELYQRKPEAKQRRQQYHSEYHRNNKDIICRRSREWNENNPEKLKERVKKWKVEKPDLVNANIQKRNASKLKATPSWANEFFMQEIYHLAKLRTELTGIEWHVDHIVPLRSHLVCGLHNEFNLQVIPATDNLKKSNTWWPDMPEPEKITQAA